MRRKMKPKTFIFYVKEAPISKKSIRFPQDIYERMIELVKADQESFWVIGFNHRNKEIYHECLFIGGIDECLMDQRILFKRLFVVGASAFILVHNHPGGNCSPPSKEDIKLTNRTKEASKILGLELLDHIIISDDGYYSFKEHFLLS